MEAVGLAKETQDFSTIQTTNHQVVVCVLLPPSTALTIGASEGLNSWSVALLNIFQKRGGRVCKVHTSSPSISFELTL